jgi:hypothetical protein
MVNLKGLAIGGDHSGKTGVKRGLFTKLNGPIIHKGAKLRIAGARYLSLGGYLAQEKRKLRVAFQDLSNELAKRAGIFAAKIFERRCAGTVATAARHRERK